MYADRARQGAFLFFVLAAGCILVFGAKGSPAEHGTNAGEYECLTTPNGIPRTVVVKKQDAFAYEDPAFTGAAKTLRYFRKYFIFKESSQGLLIGEGTLKAAILGWVHKEAVLPWDTAQALFFINKKAAGRQPVQLWRSKGDVGKVGKPHFEESLDRDMTTEPFPVLANEHPMVNIAFLWDAKEGSIPALHQDLTKNGGDQVTTVTGQEVDRGSEGKEAPGGSEAAQQIIEQVKRMDVVLVMDVTGSMGPSIQEVQANLVKIVKSLSDIAGPTTTVHVGAVAYRDYADKGSTFVTKRLDLTDNAAEIIGFLNSLNASGGAGRNEAVCDALYEGTEGMSWGEHSFRVMCLVGDAPPHTAEDEDIVDLKEAGTLSDSGFLGKSFKENLGSIRRAMEKHRIQLYALGVRDDPQMKEMFKQFVDAPDMFLTLANAQHFIRALEAELRKGRVKHAKVVTLAEKVRKRERSVASLTDPELELFTDVGLNDPALLAELQEEQIQRGWFNYNKNKDNVLIAVYLRRPQLEEWGIRLRLDLRAFREKQENVMQDIMGAHSGSPLRFKGMGELLRAADDLAFKPAIFRLENLTLEEKVLATKLRRKLNNILKLTWTEGLFNEYEEGWVPTDFLPGDFSEVVGRTATKTGSDK